MHQVSYLPYSSGFRLSCNHVGMNFHMLIFTTTSTVLYDKPNCSVCLFNISAFFDFNKFLISQIVKSGLRGVEMNCIANDSKCAKFRNICFIFGPAPEEKPYYLMYASMNNQGQ